MENRGQEYQGHEVREHQGQEHQHQGQEHPPQEHKRRVRYKGTHPKKYNEKYKELQPEKYPETVAKVISKGSTPVGMHISIMVKEILDLTQPLDMADIPRKCSSACKAMGISMPWTWTP